MGQEEVGSLSDIGRNTLDGHFTSPWAFLGRARLLPSRRTAPLTARQEPRPPQPPASLRIH